MFFEVRVRSLIPEIRERELFPSAPSGREPESASRRGKHGARSIRGYIARRGGDH
jgi:hypothetical protein